MTMRAFTCSALLSAATLLSAQTASAQAQGTAPPLLPPPPARAAAPAAEAPKEAPKEAEPPLEAPAPALPAPPRASPAPAPAPAPVLVRAEASEEPEGPPSARGFRVTGGLKLAYVATSGFDTFAASDSLPYFSVEASDGIFHRGRLTLGVGLGFEAGGRSSDLRGLDAKLQTQRIAVPLEARWAASNLVWGVFRLAPGATHASASISDASAPAKLEDSTWGFSLDASVGAAFVLGGASGPNGGQGGQSPPRRGPRFILLPEVGWTFASSLALAPKPGRDAEDVIGADGTTRIPEVALSGFFWRATAGVVF